MVGGSTKSQTAVKGTIQTTVCSMILEGTNASGSQSEALLLEFSAHSFLDRITQRMWWFGSKLLPIMSTMLPQETIHSPPSWAYFRLGDVLVLYCCDKSPNIITIRKEKGWSWFNFRSLVLLFPLLWTSCSILAGGCGKCGLFTRKRTETQKGWSMSLKSKYIWPNVHPSLKKSVTSKHDLTSIHLLKCLSPPKWPNFHISLKKSVVSQPYLGWKISADLPFGVCYILSDNLNNKQLLLIVPEAS